MTTNRIQNNTFDPNQFQVSLDDVHRAGMPGIIADVVDSGEDWCGAAGLAETATGTPMTPKLHHRVGSIAKTFTTVALLRLVEDGLVDLDDTVSRYFPRLVPGERGNSITVRMLANHTSGLSEYLPVIFESLRSFPDLTRTSPRSLRENRFTRFNRRELIAEGIRAPASGEPGATPGRYSNTNYLLLSELIELVTGQAAEEHISTEVIAPSGLRNTYFPVDPTLDNPNSQLYESWFGMADPALECGVYNMSWVGPAASLVSTAEDLNQFFAQLIGGRLLRPESLAEMKRTVPVISFEGATIDYGLGLHRRREAGTTYWGHDGSVWGGGSLSMILADGQRQMTVLINRQRWNSLDDSGRPLPHEIDKALARVHPLGMR